MVTGKYFCRKLACKLPVKGVVTILWSDLFRISYSLNFNQGIDPYHYVTEQAKNRQGFEGFCIKMF